MDLRLQLEGQTNIDTNSHSGHYWNKKPCSAYQVNCSLASFRETGTVQLRARNRLWARTFFTELLPPPHNQRTSHPFIARQSWKCVTSETHRRMQKKKRNLAMLRGMEKFEYHSSFFAGKCGRHTGRAETVTDPSTDSASGFKADRTGDR